MASVPQTPDEARAALALIEQTAQRLRQALSTSALGDYLIIWGLVWSVGFLNEALFPALADPVWLVADGMGLVATLGATWRQIPRVRSRQQAAFGRQIGALWLGLLLYGGLIVLVAQPHTAPQLTLLIALVAMLGYFVTGVWTRSRALLGLSLTLTAAMLLGYAWLRPWFALWMAFWGGGGLLAGGLYLRYGLRRQLWRPSTK